jgi:hypothetical protein
MLGEAKSGRAKQGRVDAKRSPELAKQSTEKHCQGKARIDNAEDLLGWLCNG